MAAIVSFVEQFLEADSPEEDLDSVPLIAAYLSTLRRKYEPNITGFVENTLQLYNELDFKHFRLSRLTYETVLEMLDPVLRYPVRPFGRVALTPNKQFLIFLWYLANKDSMREIARVFGVSRFTVHRCVRRVSKAICYNLLNKLVKWPEYETQERISSAVKYVCGLEGCAGFVDGTHIRLSSVPKDDKKSYINRKGFTSVVLQLVVTDELLITDTYVGWPGSTHDARVYRNSPLYQILLKDDGTFLSPGKFLIGDGAYPLSTFMMTPFKQRGGCNLSHAERYYNTKLSSARQAVERAIGHLKGRFRRLTDLDCKTIRDACYIITAACVLHNLCILSHDDIEHFVDQNAVHDQAVNFPPVYPNEAGGVQRRNDLVRSLQRPH